MRAVLASLDKQIGWCDALGSPFTAKLLHRVRDDVDRGGAFAAMLADWPGDPVADALPLRVAGALHALVLQGVSPELAGIYPPNPAVDAPAMASALTTALERHRAFITAFLASPPQTNEVGRSAVLLGGFLEIAARTALPLRLLEIGASAGLNTIWDQYSYRLGEALWGPSDSPVQLAPDWMGGLPQLEAKVIVRSRRCCDVAPIDLEDPAQRLRLRAYVWADQYHRLRRLDGAMNLRRAGVGKVEQADASAWVRDRLAELAPGCVSVVYHSIMWPYLSPGARDDLAARMSSAGEAATPSAPLAWLRFEAPPDDDREPALRLTLWPGGEERRLAEADAHGRHVVWLGG